ncbi:uncharacterized protein [Narcine bancroftii]|uniref:uncharacterized protein isoform X3 n=1 Tax=Narcine bancroftii TaxID=1343680 RepID=UPI0038320341
MDLFRKIIMLQILLSTAGNDDHLMIVQSPSHLSAREGDMVTMTCWINSSRADMRVEWNKKLLEKETLLLTSKWNKTIYYFNSSERLQHFFNATVSLLTISRVVLNDTGYYICQAIIEIPSPVFSKCCNGTYLHVQVGFKENPISNDSTIEDSTYINIHFRNKEGKSNHYGEGRKTRYVTCTACKSHQEVGAHSEGDLK